MKIAWLQDSPGFLGGAELTASEFRAAAPDGTEIVDMPPGEVSAECDMAIIQNCVHYTAEDLEPLRGKRVIKYAHDIMRHLQPGVLDWLTANAEMIFCSPLQRDYMGLKGECIPPALEPQGFKPPRQHIRNGKREGVCSIAQWRNPDKGALAVQEWAEQNGVIHAYGPGGFPPHGEAVDYRGDLGTGQGVAQTLWGYSTFLFLPIAIEPFCRTVVEAHFAGCEVITNRLIGARHYLENDPGALETAAEDFWAAVCG